MAERFRDRLVVVDSADREVFAFDAKNAVLDLGAQGNEGDLRIRGEEGEVRFHFDGGRQLFYVRDSSGRDVLHFHGPNSQLRLGSQSGGNAGDVYIFDNAGNDSITLRGGAGDIILQNADCAEEFETGTGVAVNPGAVVVLDDDGRVRPSTREYDTRVAGIVSGAGGYRPGIVLDRHQGPSTRVPVALMGKTFCLVDASSHPVHPGDLLTTADTAGHAMVAKDRARATGAVVGKALRALPGGTGLVPVLVALG